jgi:Tripartite tricarboxylate transporter TctB family
MSGRSRDRSYGHMRQLPRAFGARGAGLVIAGVLATAGALFVWQSARLELGGFGLPGPGFFPLLLGAALMVSAALVGAGCWRSADREVVELGHRDVLIVIASLLLVALMFEPLGAYLTLGLLAAAMLLLIARIPLPLAMVAAGLVVAACWYFFHVLLGLQLPTGPL